MGWSAVQHPPLLCSWLIKLHPTLPQTNGYSPTGHLPNNQVKTKPFPFRPNLQENCLSLHTQVVPELSPELAALNLNMEELTQSAYDLR